MQSEIFRVIGQGVDQVCDQVRILGFNLAMLVDGVSRFTGCI